MTSLRVQVDGRGDDTVPWTDVNHAKQNLVII